MIEIIQKLTRFLSAEPIRQLSPLDDLQSKILRLIGGIVYVPGSIELQVDGKSKIYACQAWHRSKDDSYWSIPDLGLSFIKKAGIPYKKANGNWLTVRPDEWLDPIMGSSLCLNDFLHIKNVLSDFDVNPLGETSLDNVPMSKWALIPSSPQLGVWHKVLVWYNSVEKMVKRIEFYNQNLELQRVMVFLDNFTFGSSKFPKKFKVVDFGQSQKESVYEIDKVQIVRKKSELRMLEGYSDFLKVATAQPLN